MNDIKYEAMDDSDIRYYLPKAKIIQYDELKKYKTIQQLLPKHLSYVIILVPVIETFNGHWVILTRYLSTIEYFSSYGTKPDIEFTWATSNFKNNEKYLSKLLSKTKLHIVYNTICFQNLKDTRMATCGAYVCFRALLLLEMKSDLEKNNLMLETLKDSSNGLSYDDIVVNYINKR